VYEYASNWNTSIRWKTVYSFINANINKIPGSSLIKCW
jgi:hypothetical protein